MIKKNIASAAIFVTLLFTTLLSSCGEEINFFLPLEFQKPVENLPEKVLIDVYWDATYSMKGYTNFAAGNVYRTLPDILSDIGSSMGEVKFYRFGENIQQLDGREYRKFSSSEPYNELVTAVHNVIDKSDNSHISVIITDLFESDSDWSNITQKIRDKYFANHQAVAIIGIKNSFNGDIFDVGLNAAKFNYNSYDYPGRFRPFYLIIMGAESSVKEFIEKFNEKQTLPNETGYLVLSENLTDLSNDFSRLQVQNMENFFADEKLNISDKRVKEFGLSSFNEPAIFTINFDYNQTLGACPIDMSLLSAQAQVMYFDENEWQVKQENDVNIQLLPLENQENKYTVKVSLTPEKSLVNGKLNFVHVVLSPVSKGYILPDWVKNWNMANVDIAPENFDGSKTVNLINILSSLKDSVFAAAHPALLNINFVVDVR